MHEKRKMRMAEGMLLLTAMIWGSGFVVMKTALDDMPIHFLLGMRFIIAAACMLVFVSKRLIRQTRADIIRGCVLGLVMYAAYATQTYGLMYTTAGQNAFLTSIYVVMVPLIVYACGRTRPPAMQMGAAVLCLIGISLLTLSGGFHMGIGNALSLLCGVLFAVHIVLVDRFTPKTDTLVLTSMQFVVCGILGLGSSMLFETAPTGLHNGAIVSIAYLAIVCTLVALTMQNIGIRYADASHASLIMGMEALFGAAFGSIFLREVITLRIFLGSALILCSIVLSKTRQNGRSQSIGKSDLSGSSLTREV